MIELPALPIDLPVGWNGIKRNSENTSDWNLSSKNNSLHKYQIHQRNALPNKGLGIGDGS